MAKFRANGRERAPSHQKSISWTNLSMPRHHERDFQCRGVDTVGPATASTSSCGLARLLQRRIDQGQIRFGIKALVHRYGVDRNHHFQGRRYVRVQNMAGARCSVRTSHHQLVHSATAANRRWQCLPIHECCQRNRGLLSPRPINKSDPLISPWK